jgi:glutathione S-transferase
MLTLHYAPGTIAAAVAIALNEAGADYTGVRVDFDRAGQRGDAFRALNPKGRVPVLVTDRGVLTETPAILDYVAAVHPHAGLVPDDPFDAARMRAVMSYLASTVHVNHAHGSRGARWADDPSSWADMKGKVGANVAENVDWLEKNAMDAPFVLGPRISLADPYLFVVCTWLAGDGVNIEHFPKLAAFQDAMRSRPSVRRAVSDGYLKETT